MKRTVFFRSTLRQPLRSLFLLLLVGVISFAFVSRVGETLLIDQEINELVTYYRSIGNLSVIDFDNFGHIPDQVIDYLEQSPYVAYVDPWLGVSGVIQDEIYNADVTGSYSFGLNSGSSPEINPADIFFYGTYSGCEFKRSTDPTKPGYYKFIVDEVILGYPEYVSPGKELFLFVDWKVYEERQTQLEYGARYLLRASYDYTENNRTAMRVLDYDVGAFRAFTWKPLAADLPWFLPASSDLDLSLPEYAQFTSELKQCDDNAHALCLTATADMSALLRFQEQYTNLNFERYYLVDGRWLNHEDHLNGNRVIAIQERFAAARGLKVGNTLTIKLRDISSAYNEIIFAESLGYQKELLPVGLEDQYQTQTENFEIVGIYSYTIPGFSSESLLATNKLQDVYIPLSAFPKSFAPALIAYDGDICSLVLNSPADEEAFLSATRKDLATMGYHITFMENGYWNFKNATDGIGTAAKSNVIIFAIILAVCFCLAVFVYFRFRRKDLAISRALGVPVGRCVISSVLPLALVGGVGIMAGSALAWRYTQGNAETLLSALVKAAKAEGATATLSMNTLVILCLILIVTLLVLALVFAIVTVKRPVLSQLQGGRNKR